MIRRLAVAGVLALALVVQLASPAAASSIDVEAQLGGRDVTTADSENPIRIEPRAELPLVLTLRNVGDRPREIRYVRLEGRALGITFLTYDLGVRLTLRPGQETTVEAMLDFFDLDDQATGYLGTSLRVYDPDRQLLAQQQFVVDVRGKATSTLGLFAIVLIAVAAFATLVVLVNTARRRLPANRFVRALQFAVAGGSIGLTLALGVSVLRISHAEAEAWVPLVFFPTVIAFALGYVAPGPLSRSIREVREEEILQLAAEEAVARASGVHLPAGPAGYAPGHHSGEHARFGQRSGQHAVAAGQRSGSHEPGS